MSHSPRLCFVALRAYGLLSGRSDIKHQGGAERQQVLLARELVRRGYAVSFVTLDHGQPDGEETGDGLRVFKAYGLGQGVRGLRFIHPRATALWSAMTRAEADVYYQRGAEAETGLVAAWCGLRNRRFVFAAAHDTNLLRALPLLGGTHERLLYSYGLRRADRIVVQTEHQRSLLREQFGLESAVVRSCWSPAGLLPVVATGHSHPDVETGANGHAQPVTVLWVGRLSPEKRPEWLVALAKDLPQHRFEVVGQSNVSSALAQRIQDELRSLPNVTLRGFLPRDQIDEAYERAAVLVCTSESEGFPNVFLEAWGHGVATVSTVDPDGLIEAHQLGLVASNYEDLKRALGRGCAEPALLQEQGHRAMAYVRAHHTPSASAATLHEVLQELWPRAASPPPTKDR